MALEFETEESQDHANRLDNIRRLEYELECLKSQLDQERQRNDDLSAHLLTSLDKIEQLLQDNDKKSNELMALSKNLAELQESQCDGNQGVPAERPATTPGQTLAAEPGDGAEATYAERNNTGSIVGNQEAVSLWREGVNIDAATVSEIAELEGSYPPDHGSFPLGAACTSISSSTSSSDTSSDSSALSDDLFQRTEDHEYWTGRYQRLLTKISSRLRRQKAREARLRKKQQFRDRGLSGSHSISQPQGGNELKPKDEGNDGHSDDRRTSVSGPGPIICNCNGSLPLPGPDSDDDMIIHNYSPLANLKPKDTIIWKLWSRHSQMRPPPWVWHDGFYASGGARYFLDAAPLHALGGALRELADSNEAERVEFMDWCLSELRARAADALFPSWKQQRQESYFRSWNGGGNGYGNPVLDAGEGFMLIIVLMLSCMAKLGQGQEVGIKIPTHFAKELGCDCGQHDVDDDAEATRKELELDMLHSFLTFLKALYKRE